MPIHPRLSTLVRTAGDGTAHPNQQSVEKGWIGDNRSPVASCAQMASPAAFARAAGTVYRCHCKRIQAVYQAAVKVDQGAIHACCRLWPPRHVSPSGDRPRPFHARRLRRSRHPVRGPSRAAAHGRPRSQEHPRRRRHVDRRSDNGVPFASSNALFQKLGPKEVEDGIWLVSFMLRSRLHRPEAENLATHRQPVQPEVVTHVLGTKRYLCARVGQWKCGGPRSMKMSTMFTP